MKLRSFGDVDLMEDSVDDLKCQSEPLDLGEDAYDLNITNALSASEELIKKSNEQNQRIDGQLALLTQEVGACEKEMASLKMKPLTTLHEQIDELKKRWEALERMMVFESDGLLGDLCLIAMYVERVLCSYTFPEVFDKDTDKGSLRDLMDFLNNDDHPVPLDPIKYDCEKVLQEAKERWEVVCKNFNFPDEWKTRTGAWEVSDCSVPSDIRAIEVLKARFNGFHVIEKQVSMKHAEEILEDTRYEMRPWQFDLVAGFIGSLREKMTKTGLHHDNILLD